MPSKGAHYDNDYVVATAQVRVCADGGANRVYDEMPLFFPHQQPSHVRTRFLLLSLAYFRFRDFVFVVFSFGSSAFQAKSQS